MFESFTRSWELTKATFKVINKDKRLLLFPIFSGIFSILFIFSLIFPALFLGNNFSWFIVFILYFGLAFIATFFNVCVVYLVKNTIEQKKTTVGQAISFAFSRIGPIFGWSLISATVGLILRLLDEIAERIGGIGEIIIKITTSLIGGIWAFLTIFVIPVMVYKNVGPFKAISESSQRIKKTWGENLIRNIGFGIAEFIFVVIGLAALILGYFLFAPLGILVLTIFFCIIGIYFVFLIMYFNIANAVFNTTLYVYSETGKMPLDFSENTAKNLFSKAKKE
jgi:MFS family permease